MDCCQLTEACGWNEPPRYIIRDRDGAYGDAFIRRITAMGIRDRPISARAERLIGSIRREYLDQGVLQRRKKKRVAIVSKAARKMRVGPLGIGFQERVSNHSKLLR
jgi:hypothetical protein